MIDGDTVRLAGGQTYRLVGFDTPETGRNARCSYERELGDAATARLRSLIRTAVSATVEPVQNAHVVQAPMALANATTAAPAAHCALMGVTWAAS